ncbi:uncharacterized protein [Salminus brasiliensis]|uniref:uncharacterized protein n=1 Tax=Salminus brasiliensis TaxID=930266 RepID=UPI003B837C3D
MDSKVEKTIQSLTTAEEMRNQTKLVMQPYANWEQYLAPAPLSVAILGELIFISSKEDFSINRNPSKDGYQHIKYPESFRACLMQVCNSGWWAFNEAHKNMDQIRLHTMTVPNYMKTAVKILFQDNDEVVKAHLSDQLKNISAIADNCVKLATSTEERFTDVINIIHELLEACMVANLVYGEQLEEVKRTMEENKLREKNEQDVNEQMKKLVNSMENELQEAQENYSKALDSLPTGLTAELLDFAHAAFEGVATLCRGLTSWIPQRQNPQARGQESAADAITNVNIYSKSAAILKWAENIERYVQEDKIDVMKLYNQKNKTSNASYLERQFCQIYDSLRKLPQCQLNDNAQQLCVEGINICRELAKYTPERQCEEARTEELIDNIRCFTENARIFDSESKDFTKSPPLTSQPPMMNSITSNNRTSWFRVEQTRAQLNKTREDYQRSMENMEKNQKELTEILVSMRNCELKEIDFNTTIQMLVKGMDAMGRVKEQWEKMVRFFRMVSSLVSSSLNRPLKDFVSTSEKTQSLSYDAKLFSKDLLYNQAFQASNIASLVHMISATYTEVSEKYLLDNISLLGTLLTMDKEKPEFEKELQELRNSCDGAQKAISDLILKNKEEFERKSDLRLEKIDNELLAILPKAAPEEMKSIQRAVEKGFRKTTTAENVDEFSAFI